MGKQDFITIVLGLGLSLALGATRGAADHPTIAIVRKDTRLEVTFTGTLQSADAPSGPWRPITNALSPFLPELGPQRKFYRTVADSDTGIFSSQTIADLEITGPLQAHFELAFAGTPDGIFPPHRDKPYFDGRLKIGSYDLPVTLRVRGDSSLQECPFPKLKFKVAKEDRNGTPFEDAREVKVGTHCADGGRGNIGRLREERAAFREALVYEMMDLLGFVSPRIRRAQISYRDTSSGPADPAGWQLSRMAFLLDDIEVVAERLGGRALSDAEKAALTNTSFDPQLLIELQLFHALAGNWDYGLMPAGEGLRNTDVIKTASGQLVPVAGDFDLASWVTEEVRASAPREYRPDLGDIERQVMYQVEQLRGRIAPAFYATAADLFLRRRADLEVQVAAAVVDAAGKANAIRHLNAFYAALQASLKQD
jgi:hypothetical protein